MSRLMPPTLKAELVAAAKEGKLVVLEIEVDGVKLYARGTSIFGPEPTPNPLEATNYAALPDREPAGTRIGREPEEFPDLDQLWYDVRGLWVKDEGGGKSALRTDIPGRIVVFDKPAAPPIAAVYLPESYTPN